MFEFINLTGMVLKSFPVGEYDRRVLILTRERGKITAFAKGARRPNSKYGAATGPFSFGVFKLRESQTAYNICDADISNYFAEFRDDYVKAAYGMYLCDVCDHVTVENNDESRMLKLLYQSLRALLSPSFTNEFVRCVFELK
nr:DNA repair protein RecO [Lachnospiraceae bacterium]